LGAIETTFWPRFRAQRAFCEAEILACAAALILRGPCDTRVLFNPLSALIAVSNAFTCCAALSRSAFNCAIMSMCSSPGEDCTGDQANVRWSSRFSMVDFISSASDAAPAYCSAIGTTLFYFGLHKELKRTLFVLFRALRNHRFQFVIR
jgi:hypothetical protein